MARMSVSSLVYPYPYQCSVLLGESERVKDLLLQTGNVLYGQCCCVAFKHDESVRQVIYNLEDVRLYVLKVVAVPRSGHA